MQCRTKHCPDYITSHPHCEVRKTHTCNITRAHQCFSLTLTYLWVCAVLGSETSSSLGDEGASGGAARFTRANTLTVGGSQLDGLLEGKDEGSQRSAHLHKITKDLGLWRERGEARVLWFKRSGIGHC